MTVDGDTLINIGILSAAIAAVLAPYHMDTRRRGSELILTVKRIERKLKQHDRRTRQLRDRVEGIEHDRMETAQRASVPQRPGKAGAAQGQGTYG